MTDPAGLARRVERVRLREGECAANGSESSGLVSVIVPLTERTEPLEEIYRAYSAPFARRGRAYEFLFAAPEWAGERTRGAADLARSGEPVRVLEVPGQGVGEGTLIQAVGARARGDIVVTLPAYFRVEPEGLLDLVERVEAGADLAVARRWPRCDAVVNRLQTRAFHVMLRCVSGGHVRDVACGVRAMPRQVLLDLPVYGDTYRFLPLLAMREGYRVEEIDIPQHPRDGSTRVYGPGTYVRRAIDVLGLFFLTRFTYKPLRFFGLVGSTFAGIGAAILLVVFVQRLGGQGIAERPMLLLGVLLLTLGVQAFAIGLIGEIIVHFNTRRTRAYRLEEPDEREAD